MWRWDSSDPVHVCLGKGGVSEVSTAGQREVWSIVSHGVAGTEEEPSQVHQQPQEEDKASHRRAGQKWQVLARQRCVCVSLCSL